LADYRGKIKRIDLLGYHRLGVGKYKALGKTYPLNEISAFDPQRTKVFIDILTGMGFDVHLEQAFKL